MKTIRRTMGVVLALGLVWWIASCSQSSHRSVSVYEYQQEPAQTEEPQTRQTETDSEYEMVAPGEMIVE